MFTRSKLVSPSLFAGLFLIAAAAFGAGDGSLSGQLTDPQGKPVSGARVRIAPARGSHVQEAHTDAGGEFAFSALPAGGYQILAANPGRPGAPVSIPGLPIETASSGIKAPQYFAPGVAGDHGEPIAMFIQVGSFLMPNNLSASAHGNGYSDPNILVPAVIESVETDGGAFNVREGNHSVDLAAVYAIRPTVEPFATFTADYRDTDLSVGWKWLAIEA